MKKLMILAFCSFVALCLTVPGLAQNCQFPEKAPDHKNFQFLAGDVIQVQQADGRWVDATVTMVIPWWDMNQCQWRVNYNAEIRNIVRFTEGDPAVRIKPLPRSAAPIEGGLR